MACVILKLKWISCGPRTVASSVECNLVTVNDRDIKVFSSVFDTCSPMLFRATSHVVEPGRFVFLFFVFLRLQSALSRSCCVREVQIIVVPRLHRLRG
mmetsp:Transcript_3060/g.5877  ORF Transcript_3060/g.5877 Transcript_3060/m.5877 type:complete len:98 (-) Transcript_3060:608-901(-)